MRLIRLGLLIGGALLARQGILEPHRRREVLRALRRSETPLTVTQIANRVDFTVSIDAVRRHLDALEDEGLVVGTGGIFDGDGPTVQPRFPLHRSLGRSYALVG